MKIQYRELNENEICRNLFQQFIRRQNVVKCWRREDGQWLIKDAPFIDDWSEADYQVLITCLKNTIATGGFVYGAFCNGILKGFSSVEAALFGSNGEYLDLTSLHVSEDMRGKGIGKTLFLEAGRWAKEHGGRKLYISGHSAVETQAFYKAMGCVEAQEYNQQHVEAEPFDCQLEYALYKH
ncbi:MAG: GNAT family N-acetyltransferase [Dorea sp.]|nr:GNAT family N-acetyltransferase [Dorea sp.]